ncbi:MAG: ribosome assembly cofactor RimP [Bacteroidales bacterium]|nr:ribosome assembly cofactor RimP [Bacteroidales bacterium]
MISADRIRKCIGEELERNGLFLIDLTVSSSNKIKVVIDSMKGITIDECAQISRMIENKFNRDEEDYDLEVTSPGLDSPLVLPVQYLKNTGRQVEVLTTDNQRIRGTLRYAGEEKIEVETETKKKIKGKKKKEIIVSRFSFSFDEIRSAKVLVTF